MDGIIDRDRALQATLGAMIGKQYITEKYRRSVPDQIA